MTNRSRAPSSRHSGSPASFRLEVPERHVERADAAEGRAGVTGLEDAREHPVVERVTGARVFAFDGGEEPVDVVVRARADARSMPSSVSSDDDRHLGDARVDEPVDVADGSPPVVEGPQTAVAGDLHIVLDRQPARSAVINSIHHMLAISRRRRPPSDTEIPRTGLALTEIGLGTSAFGNLFTRDERRGDR